MYLYYFKIGKFCWNIYSFTIHFYVLEVNIDTKISHLLNYNSNLPSFQHFPLGSDLVSISIRSSSNKISA